MINDPQPFNLSNEIDYQEFIDKVSQLADHQQAFQQYVQQALPLVSKPELRRKLEELMVTSLGESQWLKQGSQRLVNKLKQFEELARISALITSALELDQVLEEVMDTVINLTGTERGYLMLKPIGSDEFVIQAARHWDGKTIQSEQVTFSHKMIAKVLETGQPLLTTDAQKDERFQDITSVMTHSLRAVIVIPLMLHGQALGVLYVDNRINRIALEKIDLAILSTFANQATIAIENARTFARIKEDLASARYEAERLKIQVDQGKVGDEVDQIADSTYFVRVAEIAREMRKRKQPGEEGDQEKDNTSPRP